MKLKIVFMGSPDFAIPSLKVLTSDFDVVGVVTKPDTKSGRGQKTSSPPIKNLALELGLEISQPNSLKNPEFQNLLHEWAPDLIVVAAFGKILPKSVLNFPKYECINVHASLLPRWRGAAPINAAILHGDEFSGVTIMKMARGLDTGDILTQRKIKLGPDETAGSLFYKLSELGADLLIKTIPDYVSGEIKPQVQDESLSTYAPMLSKADGLIDPQNDIESLSRQIRAFTPWPSSFLKYNGINLKIHKVSIQKNNNSTIGKRTIQNKMPAIHVSGGLLILETVQKAGSKKMNGEDFLRGSRNWESK